MANRQKTLLLVDDQPDELNLRKIVLEHSGYTVLTAANGSEGLALLASHAIDEVLLDYQMPGMNGGLVADAMRKAYPGVPILMLSGCVSLPKSALQFVDGFIAKGNSSRFLLKTVERLLHNFRNRKPVRSVRCRLARKATARLEFGA